MDYRRFGDVLVYDLISDEIITTLAKLAKREKISLATFRNWRL